MDSSSPTYVLEQWVRAQPGSYIHPEVHISDSEETGVHWHAAKEVDAGTRYVESPAFLSTFAHMGRQCCLLPAIVSSYRKTC